MKRLLLVLLALLAPSLGGQSKYQLYQYDVDDTAYVYPQLCTGQVAGVAACPGNGLTNGSRLATTSAVNSTDITAVNADGPFLGIAVGDIVVFNQAINATTLLPIGAALRKVTEVTSANAITVATAVTLPTAGSTLAWFRTTTGTGLATDGWFPMGKELAQNINLTFDQISATGGVTYKVECRNVIDGAAESATIIAGDTAVTAANTAARVNFDNEPWDQCRVGLKITTADDDGVVITSTTDDIDWKEYKNSYTISGSKDDLDFVEDSGGTPKVCVAANMALPAAGTGAAWCTVIAAAMNAAACTPDNTYSCTYSTTTHKFTIARATGSKTIDLLWNTGANTATSVKTELGYANTDDTGATTYASDTATGETTFTQNLDAGTYSGTSACVEVAAEMNATSSVTATYACSYSADTDKITISASGGGLTQLMILWDTGTNNATSCDTALGFAADSTGALTYTGAALDSFNAAEVEKISVTLRRGAQ